MKNISTYSKRKFKLKFNIWDFNAISVAKAFNIPHKNCNPFNIDEFFYNFEKEHNLLNTVAENTESYSYS